MKHVKTVLFIIVIVSFALVPIVAAAHPGRTDAEGGHTDSRTGEYHYHTGATPADETGLSARAFPTIEVTTIICIFVAFGGSGYVVVISLRHSKKKQTLKPASRKRGV